MWWAGRLGYGMIERDALPARSFVTTAAGVLHIASCGEGVPVLLLHQPALVHSTDPGRDGPKSQAATR